MRTKDLYPWKKSCLHYCLVLVIIILYSGSLAAQCGNTLNARIYDTLITGIGYGNYTFSFPQWNADSGTLLSVKIGTRVSLQYGFTLKNADVVPSIYTIVVGRVEQISSPAMSSPYNNTVQQNLGVFPLSPGSQVSQAPFSFLHDYANTDSITGAVAPFIGSGNLSFAYAPITYTDIQTNNNSSYSYSATARDTVHFSLIYTYCTAAILASSLIRFTAAPEAMGSVQLSWAAVNEVAGRVYQVEESRDGLHFKAAGSLPSAGTGSGEAEYAYTCKLPPGSQGKWYFRLQIIDPGTNSSYSEMKAVTVGASGKGISVYPNPATDYIHIVFDQAAGNVAGATSDAAAVTGNRQVDILAADGRLLQREIFILSATAARINFRRPLAAGAYFVRVMAPQATESYTSSFLVR